MAELLREWNLAQFVGKLVEEGFDDLRTLGKASDAVLASVGMREGHIIRFREATEASQR